MISMQIFLQSSTTLEISLQILHFGFDLYPLYTSLELILLFCAQASNF
jgi:hypothetical protein